MRVADALVVARNVLDKHRERTGPLTKPVPVLGDHGLLETITQTQKVRVEAMRVPWTRNIVSGRMDLHHGSGGRRARIVYASSLNICWSRFVICKEAVSALLYEENSATNDVVSHVAGLISQTPDLANDGVMADILAAYGAIELLFPAEFTDDLYQMADGGRTHRQIAEAFRGPEAIVSFRLSPRLRDMFDKFYNS